MRKSNSLRNLISIIFFSIILYGKAQESLTQKLQQTKPSSIVKFSVDFTDVHKNFAQLPIVFIKGKEPGKTLTVLAGIHGYEYPPIIAVQAFLKEIKPEDLKGTIILLPITNTAAFYGRSLFVNPLDGVNLNNAFPGKENGSVTEQISNYITKNIIPLTDVFLDIHGGDASEDLIPFVCYYNHKGKPRKTTMAKELSEASGFTNVVSYPYALKDTDPAKYAFKQAVQDGKVGLSFEAGRLGNVQKDAVALNKNGIYNVMQRLNMYKSNLEMPKQLKKYNNQVYIRAPARGIFYSDIKAGDFVTQGQQIGYITNEFGETVKNINASASGVVLYMVGTPPVIMEDTLFCIGIPE